MYIIMIHYMMTRWQVFFFKNLGSVLVTWFFLSSLLGIDEGFQKFEHCQFITTLTKFLMNLIQNNKIKTNIPLKGYLFHYVYSQIIWLEFPKLPSTHQCIQKLRWKKQKTHKFKHTPDPAWHVHFPMLLQMNQQSPSSDKCAPPLVLEISGKCMNVHKMQQKILMNSRKEGQGSATDILHTLQESIIFVSKSFLTVAYLSTRLLYSSPGRLLVTDYKPAYFFIQPRWS